MMRMKMKTKLGNPSGIERKNNKVKEDALIHLFKQLLVKKRLEIIIF